MSDLERCPVDPESDDVSSVGRPGVRVPVGAYVICVENSDAGYVRGGTDRECLFEDEDGRSHVGHWSNVFVQAVGLAPGGPR
jgi:hypothetical protein